MTKLRTLCFGLAFFTFASCGAQLPPDKIKDGTKTGDETTDLGEDIPPSLPGKSSINKIFLSRAANLRNLSANILEVTANIPAGTQLEISDTSAPVFHKYRDADGSVKMSTSGFYPGLKIITVPPSYVNEFPQEVMDRLNATAGGLYLSSNDVNSANESGSVIPPLPSDRTPSEDYLSFFNADGKRHSNPFAARLSQRFGAQFNKAIPWSSMTPAEKTKWTSIYRELVEMADRTRETSRSALFLDTGNADDDVALAKQFSIDFENSGTIQKYGAWNIATQGTAVRHGFAPTPCAEFMSEVVRQAYTKAGYIMKNDFKGNNYLLWSNTALVTNFATALHSAGWIPWDPAVYKPMVGAIGMNAYADSPGHTYMIAGANGRFLVDNGSPKGRDLYSTSKKNINNMFNLGTFFLPPGIIPEKW